jgi:catechol 2,3-dioxygenase-like lactoylglutathione lyase family enzyme
MITGVDHIVIAVHDLNAAIQTYTQLGFTVVEGGRHPTGSYNALVAFADGAYIELLAFYETSPNHQWWDLLHQRGGGLIDFCMVTDDIRADHQAFDTLGVHMSGLVDLSRKRPDGYLLEWLNTEVYGDYKGIIPFIIEDKTPRTERVPKETSHANGVTGIHTLTFATADLTMPQTIMGAMLGEPQTITDPDLNASGICWVVGNHTLAYLMPNDATSPLYDHIKQNKPVPYSLCLSTTGDATPLSPEETEGVRIYFV